MTTFTEETGNLLEAEVDALVNTVNTVGVMGKGIALQFKNAFPDNYEAYRRACKDETASSIGRCTVPVMMTGANTSTNRWRYQHARRTAGVARTRGDLLRSS